MSRVFVELGDVEALHETGKALLCEIAGAEYWVPFSQIGPNSEVRNVGDHGALIVSRWWADVSDLGDQATDPPPKPPPSSGNILRESNTIYRQLASKYHPDRSSGTAEVMRDINQLWQAVKRDLEKGK